MAKICRFYGMRPSEYLAEEAENIFKLNDAIERLEAQEMLVALKVSAYPQMKKEDRRSTHREVYKAAYPEGMAAKSATWEDISRILGQR